VQSAEVAHIVYERHLPYRDVHIDEVADKTYAETCAAEADYLFEIEISAFGSLFPERRGFSR